MKFPANCPTVKMVEITSLILISCGTPGLLGQQPAREGDRKMVLHTQDVECPKWGGCREGSLILGRVHIFGTVSESQGVDIRVYDLLPPNFARDETRKGQELFHGRGSRVFLNVAIKEYARVEYETESDGDPIVDLRLVGGFKAHEESERDLETMGWAAFERLWPTIQQSYPKLASMNALPAISLLVGRSAKKMTIDVTTAVIAHEVVHWDQGEVWNRGVDGNLIQESTWGTMTPTELEKEAELDRRTQMLLCKAQIDPVPTLDFMRDDAKESRYGTYPSRTPEEMRTLMQARIDRVAAAFIPCKR